MEGLSEEDRKALRGSKFAPLPPSKQQPRLAHPGGPLKTNKAAALAKFLERKLQDPNGLSSINPDLVELAVKNAKHSVSSSGTSKSGTTIIHHVASFGDSDPEDSAENGKVLLKKQKRKKKRRKKNKKQKIVNDSEDVKLKTTKKKMKF
ncbi:uncharacterized protein LOC126667583 [Mercurialis annua]|uniref:uncharacterized protein LOC126667583 n=1 Tax=Mercurialis annua TaxID=3986 RepID=UPI00215F9A02|nr:uncharacterized protein LOC126667583 [Mercurialis annua]